MTSAAHELTPHPPKEPGAALAYTPEQAAAVIGGTCKAYLLRKLARDRKIDCLRIGGHINFTRAHIDQAIAYFTVAAGPGSRPAGTKRTPAGHQPATDPAALFPVPGAVVQLRARPAKRTAGG